MNCDVCGKAVRFSARAFKLRNGAEITICASCVVESKPTNPASSGIAERAKYSESDKRFQPLKELQSCGTCEHKDKEKFYCRKLRAQTGKLKDGDECDTYEKRKLPYGGQPEDENEKDG